MSVKLQYTLYGALFGCCFPLFAIILEIATTDLHFNLSSIALAHKQNVLIYMIDTAPIFLGLFAMIGGISKAKAVSLVNEFKTLSVNLKKSNEYLNNYSGKIFAELMKSTKKVEELTNILVNGNKELYQFNINCKAKADSLNKSSVALLQSTSNLIEHNKDLNIMNHRMYDEINLVQELNMDLLNHFKSIESIGTEIRILSINSSIEAHKYGELGKGFNVIANQIKSLSNSIEDLNKKTQEISESLNDQIHKIILNVSEQKNEIENDVELITEIESHSQKNNYNLEAINNNISESLNIQENQQEQFAHINSEMTSLHQEKISIIKGLKNVIEENNVLIARISSL